ncbi:hypothetical protein ACLBKU_04700 [Erythrobacter sp. NE805]|uniref:hypothetical protein n=1 Tax=Erythrobacter sp. NE805 TaxID=3389875 RepID=UPI00396AF54B
MSNVRRSWKAGFPKKLEAILDPSNAHPLDGCDPDELYKVMMAERTELNKARRESEDNFVKSIIQLSSGLLLLLAGFAVNARDKLTDASESLFGFCAFSLLISICAGLAEHHLSAKAHQRQQEIVERYYTKVIKSYSEPLENFYVRMAQLIQFLAFAAALLFLMIIAASQIGETNVRQEKQYTATSAAITA